VFKSLKRTRTRETKLTSATGEQYQKSYSAKRERMLLIRSSKRFKKTLRLRTLADYRVCKESLTTSEIATSHTRRVHEARGSNSKKEVV
jgi:hypothetical protein